MTSDFFVNSRCQTSTIISPPGIKCIMRDLNVWRQLLFVSRFCALSVIMSMMQAHHFLHYFVLLNC